MKLLRILLGLMLILVLCMGTVTHAAEEIIIDVVDNELQVQGYRVELAQVDKPITVDLQNNEIILYVMSTVGEVELNLGPGTIALTQRSVEYVQLTPNAQGGPTSSNKVSTVCKDCGASNKNGEHICPRCGLPYCKHDDSKCVYRLNPLPTAFSTTDAEGNTISFYVAKDGTYYIGTPTGMPKIDSWQPGVTFGASWATPSPTPTYLIGPGATATPSYSQ